MQIAGIIAEYNPFHNGHAYQAAQTKKITQCDFVIAVMSGHFSQRGLPCITDKFTRTKMALENGIDVVLELPAVYASASAERFAQAAVSIFHKSGCTSFLSFGSESGDLDHLSLIAQHLHAPSEEERQVLKNFLKDGYSFPRAREAMLKTFISYQLPAAKQDAFTKLINNPNNILGIEYLKALMKYNSTIKPITIKRKASAYHETTPVHSSITSATAIRKAIHENLLADAAPFLSAQSIDLLAHYNHYIFNLEGLFSILQYKFMFSPKDDLYSYWDIPDDLIRSIATQLCQTSTMQELINRVTSKTYTRATVQRALLRILLDVKDASMHTLLACDWIPYIRVLGCKKSAFPVLKLLTQTAAVPVITNFSKAYGSASKDMQLLLDYERHATFLYYQMLHKPAGYMQDFTQAFIKC